MVDTNNINDEEVLAQRLYIDYIKNSDGLATNATLWVFAKINIQTNELIDVTYEVDAFADNPNALGYHRSEHKNYNDAKKQYNDLFIFHVGNKNAEDNKALGSSTII